MLFELRRDIGCSHGLWAVRISQDNSQDVDGPQARVYSIRKSNR
jgi:hypothetical protein